MPAKCITHTHDSCACCRRHGGRTTRMYIMVEENKVVCSECAEKPFRLYDRGGYSFNVLSYLKILADCLKW